MKKKLSVLLAMLVLSLAMGTTALAAPSPELPPNLAPDISKDTTDNANLSEAEYRAMSKVFGAWMTADGRFTEHKWDGTDAAARLNEKALQIVKEYAGIAGYGRADILAFMNLSVREGVITEGQWRAGVAISLMDVPADGYAQYVIFHVRTDGLLEVVPYWLEGGRINGTFNSLSPVIIVGLKESTQASATDSSGVGVELKVTAGDALAGANGEEATEYHRICKTWQESGKNDLAKLLEQRKDGSITEREYKEKRSELLTKCFKEIVSSHSQVKFDTIQWFGEANISLSDGAAMPEGGLDITLYDPEITKGSVMILLHIKSDGTIEEIRNLKVEDGAITGHFQSLSPVVYFKVASKEGSVAQPGNQTNTQRPETGTQTGAQTSGTTSQRASSPKTGEQGQTAPFCLAAMLAVCEAVYLGRRRIQA